MRVCRFVSAYLCVRVQVCMCVCARLCVFSCTCLNAYVGFRLYVGVFVVYVRAYLLSCTSIFCVRLCVYVQNTESLLSMFVDTEICLSTA